MENLSVSGINGHVGDFTVGFGGREEDQIALAQIAFGYIGALGGLSLGGTWQ
ncbi:hypothetical protein D3C73_1652990 [compost metagenome]